MVGSRHTKARMVVAVLVAVGAVGLTTTAVSVGTRGMARDLSLTTAELGWVVNAYLVAAAALVLVGARLGDVVGRVRTFEIGLGIFLLGSVLGVLSPGFGVLVLARIGQGVGAALILPATIELIAEYSRAGRERVGFRWRGLVYASSFAVGPLIGGVLTDWLSWRWIFGIDAALAGVAGLVVLPLRHRPGRGTHAPTRDFAGSVLVSLLVASVVLLAEQLGRWETTWRSSIVLLVVMVAASVALWRHERRTEHPLVHPALLRNRLVLGANVATVGASIGMLGLLYFFNLFAQSAVGFDDGAFAVLLAMAPFIASLVLCAQFAHWFGHRVGPRGPAVLGLVLMTAGFALLATTTAGTTRSEMVLPLVLSGLGAGIANASLTSVAVLDLPAGRINEAAGWISLSRFLGSAMALAVGTAAFLSVATPALAVDAASAADPAPPRAFDAAIANLDRDLSGPLLAAAEAATAEQLARTMLLTAIVLAVITVLSWWLLGGRRRVPEAVRAARAGGDPPSSVSVERLRRRA